MIVDGHTDVLWKMLKDPNIDFYKDVDGLAVNFPNLVKGNVNIQVFAIFVSTFPSSRFTLALKSIDDFYQKIHIQDKIEIATNNEEINKILAKGSKVAILSLEGAESIEGDLFKLRTLYRLGVRAIGLTWNYANEVADGILEERGGGLTKFGFSLIDEVNHLGMLIDVSHLSEKGFYEVLEKSQKPILASHSNCREICSHPRNLTDKQIKSIIDVNGIIGVTFVSNFVSDGLNPTIDDLLLHFEHIAELGGIKNIGLGSDFDGANTIVMLENASKYSNLINALIKNYNNEHVEGIMGQNWLNYYKRVL